MAFFKKNIVLANSKTVGYVTVIRISNNMGIKLTLNEAPTSKVFLGIFSDRDKFFDSADGIKSEYENLYLDIKSEDNLGVCLFNEKGNIVAYGGKTNIIDKVKIEKYLFDLKELEKKAEEKEVNNNEIDLEYIEKQEISKVNSEKIVRFDNKSYAKNDLEVIDIEKEPMTVSKKDIEIISYDKHNTDEMIEESCEDGYCDMEKLKESLSEANIEIDAYNDIEFMESTNSVDDTIKTNIHNNDEQKKGTLHNIEKKDVKMEINKEKIKKQSVDYKESKSSDESVEDLLNKGKSKNYYYSIKEKLEELMIIHPPEEILEEIVPDSKWVMVHYTKTDYYVVGVLKSNNSVTHIAYGLRGMENVPPPKEAKDFCDFITTEKKNGKNYGYYLFFQSAENGEIVKGL